MWPHECSTWWSISDCSSSRVIHRSKAAPSNSGLIGFLRSSVQHQIRTRQFTKPPQIRHGLIPELNTGGIGCPILEVGYLAGGVPSRDMLTLIGELHLTVNQIVGPRMQIPVGVEHFPFT